MIYAKVLMLALPVAFAIVACGEDANRGTERISIPDGTQMEKEYAEFYASIFKAKDKLLAVLQSALADETKKGNLEQALMSKAEIERLSQPGVQRCTVDTKVNVVSGAQQAFASSVVAEKKKFLLALEAKVKETTKAGKLDEALKMRDEKKLFLGVPPDAREVNGHFYKCYHDLKSWNDARQLCEAQGGYLAVVETKEENVALIKAFGDTWQNGWAIWIGGSNENQGNWIWITGSPMNYFTWLPGEPNGGKNKRLAFAKRNGDVAWDDAAPDIKMYYLCEWGY